MKIQYPFVFVVICSLFGLKSFAQENTLPKLPSGSDEPKKFGAYYTNLKYTPEWDKDWRIGEYADVVVRFDNAGYKLVFWHGTSYIPCWVTDNGIWYTNEFVERRGFQSPNTDGCVEPMSDKQCRYSQVSIVENNDARVIIHWRYAPVDVHYQHPFIDSATGWFDWVDEYYVVYPDASCIRQITVRSGGLDKWIEYQESIVINQPGTFPDDNIDSGAVSISNMEGSHVTYYWNENGGPPFDKNPLRANILKINLKSKFQPFALVAPPNTDGSLITCYKGHTDKSKFNWWDHWPVSQVASDGRRATTNSRPSHTSLCHIDNVDYSTAHWEPYAKSEGFITKLLMNGMTNQSVEKLVPLAKSWINAPKLTIENTDFESEGYNQAQKAYIINLKENSSPALNMSLEAGKKTPIINPAFVIKNWGDGIPRIMADGKVLKKDDEFRYGIENVAEGKNLIVWIRKTSEVPLNITLESLKTN